VTTTRTSTLSRRALLGIGGSALLGATLATAWRWRMPAGAARPAPPGRPIPYADHEGWMVSPAEKRALQAQSGQPAGQPAGAPR
jgi:hypothetical protein